jgi:hypothetical protein
MFLSFSGYAPRRTALVAVIVLASLKAVPSFADSAKSLIVDRQLRSEHIAHNKIGSDPLRKLVVYLPAGYNESSMKNTGKRYPVIYFSPART